MKIPYFQHFELDMEKLTTIRHRWSKIQILQINVFILVFTSDQQL